MRDVDVIQEQVECISAKYPRQMISPSLSSECAKQQLVTLVSLKEAVDQCDLWGRYACLLSPVTGRRLFFLPQVSVLID